MDRNRLGPSLCYYERHQGDALRQMDRNQLDPLLGYHEFHQGNEYGPLVVPPWMSSKRCGCPPSHRWRRRGECPSSAPHCQTPGPFSFDYVSIRICYHLDASQLFNRKLMPALHLDWSHEDAVVGSHDGSRARTPTTEYDCGVLSHLKNYEQQPDFFHGDGIGEGILACSAILKTPFKSKNPLVSPVSLSQSPSDPSPPSF